MRRAWALECIDQRRQRGVELGPLAAPIAAKADGSVIYVDHADAAALREKYAHDVYMRTHLDEIVEVDLVLPEGQSLSEALAGGGPFDYVIASHVIEHIPDVVSWLGDIHRLLAPGGILSLVVPDKRFTFDVTRVPTCVPAVLDAYYRRLVRPSFAQIFDFFSNTVPGVDAAKVWSGEEDYRTARRSDVADPFSMAWEQARALAASEEFVDVHCHVFTPASFLEVLDALVHLDLLDYEVASFHPTARGDIEFFASLRSLDGSSRGVRDRQEHALDAARRSLDRAERPGEDPAPRVRTGPATGAHLHSVVTQRVERALARWSSTQRKRAH